MTCIIHSDGLDITDIYIKYNELRLQNQDIIDIFKDVGYIDVAERIEKCCNVSHFLRCPRCGTYHFVDTWNCKNKFCYVCSKKRYLLYVARYMPIFKEYIVKGNKLLNVTFTLKNMENLKEMLERFNKTFKKFREKYAIYYDNVEGAVVSREITNIGNGWHVHFHTILVMKVNYNMSDDRYQRLLRDAWETKTKDSWSIKVKSVFDKGDGLIKSACELFKYMTKLKMLKRSFMKELYDTTYRRRLISTVGCMYGKVSDDQIEKELECVETRDIINLCCAVCGLDATKLICEYYNTDSFIDKDNGREHVYSLKYKE